jgi:hypothetical protein
MPSTSTTLSVRVRPASRTGVGSGRQAPQAPAGVRRVFHRPNVSAGVAQLVERQPSKLNVASSSLVSRSVTFLGFGRPNPKPGHSLASTRAGDFGAPTPKSGHVRASTRAGGFGRPNPKPGHSLASTRAGDFGAPTPKSGDLARSKRAGGVSRTPEWASVSDLDDLVVSGAAVASVPPRVGFLFCFAHLAQLVEHVLGKDEVTSSILVVGSKRLRYAARLSGRALLLGRAPVEQSVCLAERRSVFAVTVVCSGAGVTTEPATH